jgi:DNA-binding IclR family transcriptional regulator
MQRWAVDDIPAKAPDGINQGGINQGGIQALDAALRVLLTMARMDGAVGVSDLARECAMPASKAHRYLSSFLHAGLVRQSGRAGKYDLGPAAIELGLAALSRHDIFNSVADDLPGLTAETGLTALLCVWGNSGPTVVRWQRAPSFVVTSLGLGTTLPVLTSATGRVFLAYLPDGVTRERLEHELERARASARLFPDMSPDRNGVERLVADTRRDGIAAIDGRFIPGLVAIAAPVLDWQGEAQAVVTLIGTDPRDIVIGSPVARRLTEFCHTHSIAASTKGAGAR